MKLLRFTRKLILNVPAPDLWQIIAHTNEVNQLAGMSAVNFTPTLGIDGEIVMNAASRSSRPLHWQEMPYEWIKGEYFSVQRIYQGSPFVQYNYSNRLQPLSDTQTELEIEIELEPRNFVGATFAPFVTGQVVMDKIVKAYLRLEKNYQCRLPQIFPISETSPANKVQLEYLLANLTQLNFEASLVEKLANHLKAASENDVTKMRPFKLANDWKAPRLEVLRLFLHATRIGLLDLQWDVLCPNCRVAKATFGTLTELRKEAHCEVCNINYDAKFDQFVELRFTSNPRVRKTSGNTYCIGGPAMADHVLAQTRLMPGQAHERELKLNLAPGTYRLRSRPNSRAVLIKVAADGAKELHLSFDGTEFTTTNEPTLAAKAGVLILENTSEREFLMLLEQTNWDDYSVSAAYVTSLQEFRDLFSSEVLAPGFGMEIRSLTLLFSDLKDSTALYERVGDSPAYALVRDHFAILAEAIAQHEGALVKTIGDAVMAVFTLPTQAVAASLQIQSEIMTWNETHPDKEPLYIKLGLHTGPVIAVNANDILDYFGTTVNIAARAQAASVGKDIIMTEAVWKEPGIIELVAEHPNSSFQTTLKGLSNSFTLHRIEPDFRKDQNLLELAKMTLSVTTPQELKSGGF